MSPLRAFAVLGALGGVLACLIAACARFEGTDAPADAAAVPPADGPGPPVPEASLDAPMGDAGLSCVGAFFCDDFEDRNWAAAWDQDDREPDPRATLAVDDMLPGGVVTGAGALRAKLLANGGPRWLRYRLGGGGTAPRRVTAAAFVRVDQNGGGDVDLFGLDAEGQGQPIVLTRTSEKTSFAIQLQGPIEREFLLLDGETFATWTLVRLSVDLAFHTLRVEVGARPPVERPIAATWGVGRDVFVQVGMIYAKTAAPWDVAFDHVRADLE